MAYSIEHFKGVVGSEGGLARNTLFMVQFPQFPGGPPASTLNLLTKSVSIPPRQINTMERNVGGYRSRVANGNITDDINMTFQLTNTGSVQTYFENWMNTIWNKNTRRAGYFQDYARRITISELIMPKKDRSRSITNNKTLQALGRFLPDIEFGPLNASFGTNRFEFNFGENTIRKVRLENAYPLTVGTVDYSNEGEGFAELTVSFTFSEWYGDTGFGGLAAGFRQF